MNNTNDSPLTIYELAMIALLNGKNIHLFNNKLGAACEHLSDVIESAEGLDNKSKEKLIRVRASLKELLEFQKDKLNLTTLPATKKIDLREIIHNTLQNISIPANIFVEQKFESNNAIIDGYQWQTEQIFQILFYNAIESIEGNGKLTILMTDSIVSDSIEVTIVDTGTGANLSESRERKNFLDVGLAWIRVYLQTCGGNLSDNTKQGKGGTFKVTLPKILVQREFESCKKDSS